ncbi:288R [Invertebrate iridescent virus Kaz2018]|nr:288R [Invertebrate iridescent virus Kaz2018]
MWMNQIKEHPNLYKNMILYIKFIMPKLVHHFRLCILKSLLIMPLLLMKSMSKQMLKMKYLDL